MIKKALGFSLLRAWDSAKAENLIKPVENEGFGEPTFGLVAGLPGARTGPGGLERLSFFWHLVFWRQKRSHMQFR